MTSVVENSVELRVCCFFEPAHWIWDISNCWATEPLLPAYKTHSCQVGPRSKFSLLALLNTPSWAFEGGLYAFKISAKISCAFGTYLYAHLFYICLILMLFQLFLVIAALFGVGLAALSCYGLGLAVGLPFGVTHQGLLFLLLGKKRHTFHK